MHRAVKMSAILAGFLCSPADCAEFAAGAFQFSDELGGFRILSISGAGTSSDPIVLEEEIFVTEPVTLVIRRRPETIQQGMQSESLSLTKIVRNSTHRVWGAFELELRELRERPSGDADGLSFSQMDVQASDVSSDRFARNHRSFRPYDSIRFVAGHVDPETFVRFSVLITDTTPAELFYLLQDPQLLAARQHGPPGGYMFANATTGLRRNSKSPTSRIHSKRRPFPWQQKQPDGPVYRRDITAGSVGRD